MWLCFDNQLHCRKSFKHCCIITTQFPKTLVKLTDFDTCLTTRFDTCFQHRIYYAVTTYSLNILKYVNLANFRMPDFRYFIVNQNIYCVASSLTNKAHLPKLPRPLCFPSHFYRCLPYLCEIYFFGRRVIMLFLTQSFSGNQRLYNGSDILISWKHDRMCRGTFTSWPSHTEAEKNGHYFAGNIFRCIVFKEIIWILNRIS